MNARQPATRLNLLRSGHRLERVQRGAGLLRRKREALVRELFAVARPAADARQKIDEAGRAAYPALLEALARHGRGGLRALSWPLPDVMVDVHAAQLWGVNVSLVEAPPRLSRTLPARGTAPALTGPAAAHAARSFESLAELLIDAAPREMLIRRLGAALAGTSRQIHTLERRLEPSLRHEITRLQRALAERERDAMVQLKHLMRRRP